MNELKRQRLVKEDVQLNEVTNYHLRASLPWMKLICYVGFGIAASIILVMLEFWRQTYRPNGRNEEILIGSIFFILGAALFASLFGVLFSSARSFSTYFKSREIHHLEKAFNRQKAFLIYAGVIAILLGLFLLIMGCFYVYFELMRPFRF